MMMKRNCVPSWTSFYACVTPEYGRRLKRNRWASFLNILSQPFLHTISFTSKILQQFKTTNIHSYITFTFKTYSKYSKQLYYNYTLREVYILSSLTLKGKAEEHVKLPEAERAFSLLSGIQ